MPKVCRALKVHRVVYATCMEITLRYKRYAMLTFLLRNLTNILGMILQRAADECDLRGPNF